VFQLDLSNPIEPLNAGLFVSPGYGTHDTRVVDSYELLFVVSGTLKLFEESEQFEVQANQTLILCPGLQHGGAAPYHPDLNFYWVHFRVRDGVAGTIGLRVPKLATVADPEFLVELFCQYISDQEEESRAETTIAGARELGFSHLVTLMLCEIGSDVTRATEVPRSRSITTRQRSIANRVQKYIDMHFRDAIGTTSIAAELGYSTDYLERSFHHARGQSIVEALHERRVSEARTLLRGSGRKNISEIAFACGFRDPRYFRRVFKRITGLTPGQFRSLYSRTHINTH